MKASLLVVAIIISLSSCTTIEYLPINLSNKVPPQLRTYTEAELSCVSDDTYKRIVLGDKRIETLRDILLSTKLSD